MVMEYEELAAEHGAIELECLAAVGAEVEIWVARLMVGSFLVQKCGISISSASFTVNPAAVRPPARPASATR